MKKVTLISNPKKPSEKNYQPKINTAEYYIYHYLVNMIDNGDRIGDNEHKTKLDFWNSAVNGALGWHETKWQDKNYLKIHDKIKSYINKPSKHIINEFLSYQ